MLAIVIICIVFFFKEGSTDIKIRPRCEAENKYEWSYHGTTNDPNRWKHRYPKCGIPGQSPIRIINLKTHGSLPKVTYKNFTKPVTSAKVENKGWSVIITPKDGVERSINWRGRKYFLEELRFHFPSENVLDDVTYDMEVQFVCKLENTGPDYYGRAVVSSLMKVVDEASEGWKPIVEILPKVLYKGDSTGLQSQLNLAELLPKNNGSFYAYDGTNTVPPCEKTYRFYVLKDIGNIGKDDLKTFNSLYGVGKADASDACRMYINVRPLIRDQNRQIGYSS